MVAVVLRSAAICASAMLPMAWCACRDRTPVHIARAAEVPPFATLQCWVQQGNTHDPLVFAVMLQPMLCCVDAYIACE